MTFCIKTFGATLALCAFASPALALKSKHLKSYESKYERLAAYYQQYCTVRPAASDCNQVVAQLTIVRDRIDIISAKMQDSIAGQAFERPIEFSGTSPLHKQYNESVARLLRINEQIANLQQRGASASNKRLTALQSEASVLHMRLLRLQSRLKGL